MIDKFIEKYGQEVLDDMLKTLVTDVDHAGYIRCDDNQCDDERCLLIKAFNQFVKYR